MSKGRICGVLSRYTFRCKLARARKRTNPIVGQQRINMIFIIIVMTRVRRSRLFVVGIRHNILLGYVKQFLAFVVFAQF